MARRVRSKAQKAKDKAKDKRRAATYARKRVQKLFLHRR